MANRAFGFRVILFAVRYYVFYKRGKAMQSFKRNMYRSKWSDWSSYRKAMHNINKRKGFRIYLGKHSFRSSLVILLFLFPCSAWSAAIIDNSHALSPQTLIFPGISNFSIDLVTNPSRRPTEAFINTGFVSPMSPWILINHEDRKNWRRTFQIFNIHEINCYSDPTGGVSKASKSTSTPQWQRESKMGLHYNT